MVWVYNNGDEVAMVVVVVAEVVVVRVRCFCWEAYSEPEGLVGNLGSLHVCVKEEDEYIVSFLSLIGL